MVLRSLGIPSSSSPEFPSVSQAHQREISHGERDARGQVAAEAAATPSNNVNLPAVRSSDDSKALSEDANHGPSPSRRWPLASQPRRADMEDSEEEWNPTAVENECCSSPDFGADDASTDASWSEQASEPDLDDDYGGGADDLDDAPKLPCSNTHYFRDFRGNTGDDEEACSDVGEAAAEIDSFQDPAALASCRCTVIDRHTMLQFRSTGECRSPPDVCMPHAVSNWDGSSSPPTVRRGLRRLPSQRMLQRHEVNSTASHEESSWRRHTSLPFASVLGSQRKDGPSSSGLNTPPRPPATDRCPRVLLQRPTRDTRIQNIRQQTAEFISLSFDSVDPTQQHALTGRMLVILRSLDGSHIYWENDIKHSESAYGLLQLNDNEIHKLRNAAQTAASLIENKHYRGAYDELCRARPTLVSQTEDISPTPIADAACAGNVPSDSGSDQFDRKPSFEIADLGGDPAPRDNEHQASSESAQFSNSAVPTAAVPLPVTPRGHSHVHEQARSLTSVWLQERGAWFVQWPLSRQQLDGRYKTVLSPPFDIELSSSEIAKFKIMVKPKRLGSQQCFKNSKGVGFIEVKCESNLAASELHLRLRFTVGESIMSCRRNSIMHDFCSRSVASLPEMDADWDFWTAMNPAKSVLVTLELAPVAAALPHGSPTGQRNELAPSEPTAVHKGLAATAVTFLGLEVAKQPESAEASYVSVQQGQSSAYDLLRRQDQGEKVLQTSIEGAIADAYMKSGLLLEEEMRKSREEIQHRQESSGATRDPRLADGYHNMPTCFQCGTPVLGSFYTSEYIDAGPMPKHTCCSYECLRSFHMVRMGLAETTTTPFYDSEVAVPSSFDLGATVAEKAAPSRGHPAVDPIHEVNARNIMPEAETLDDAATVRFTLPSGRVVFAPLCTAVDITAARLRVASLQRISWRRVKLICADGRLLQNGELITFSAGEVVTVVVTDAAKHRSDEGQRKQHVRHMRRLQERSQRRAL